MRRIPLRFVIPALLPFLIITAAFAGGWAIVTVHDLPDYAVSGRPVSLTFTVRQHGMTPLAGLKPSARHASGHPDASPPPRHPTGVRRPDRKERRVLATLTFRQRWRVDDPDRQRVQCQRNDSCSR